MSLKHVEARRTALKRGHESLDRDIAEWREWWNELSELGKPHFGEMGDRLGRFRERLVAHFAYEESEGLFSLAADVDRHVAKQLTKLQKEHAELLAALDWLIDQLHCCEPPFDCWGKARDEFEDFLDRLSVHEEAEEKLIAELQ